MSNVSTIIGLDPGIHTGLAVFQNGALVELATIHPASIRSALVQWSPKRVVFEDSRLQGLSSANGSDPYLYETARLSTWSCLYPTPCWVAPLFKYA